MDSITNDSFGPLIAYLIPGATALIGLQPYFPALQKWFATSSADGPTLGGFLYLTIAAIAAGMAVSAIRWTVVDRLHAIFRIKPPILDFSRLQGRVDGVSLLIEIHYRHYLHYSNMFVATAISYSAYRAYWGFGPSTWKLDVAVATVEFVFFIASRDTLQKYYTRSQQLLSSRS
jgi:hypothetical protein